MKWRVCSRHGFGVLAKGGVAKVEGITHQPPKAPSHPRLPYQNFLNLLKSLEYSKKKSRL
jgi:hypothetical protein